MIHLLLAIIYLSFISLGLPDSLLGAAWPSVYQNFCVPVSYAGIVSMIIAVGTVISSLQSDRLTKKFGTGLVTTASVAMTAAALLGFSVSHSFWLLCLWAIPYGLGAGSVDASLNNYVALHFASRHMSWLHCMWGIGASLGPYIMGQALNKGYGWNTGYGLIAAMQIVLTGILIAGLPLWKKRSAPDFREEKQAAKETLTLRQILKLSGAKEVMAAFFCYSAIEQTTGLWTSSYLKLEKGISAETAAGCASLFFIGITIGRALGGFLTMRLNDTQMIRLGQGTIAFGIVILLIPSGELLSQAGLILIGLGCAPIYPCIIHSTPNHFGAGRSQAVIGVQMASAYVGTSLMPPLFGILAGTFGAGLFPVYLSVVLILMIFMHERLLKKA
ncbi:MAG: MFS transporter [Lachnospiraceae bacterium]|nr:MFS transporter [Lachnospiraceae bacterium]